QRARRARSTPRAAPRIGQTWSEPLRPGQDVEEIHGERHARGEAEDGVEGHGGHIFSQSRTKPAAAPKRTTVTTMIQRSSMSGVPLWGRSLASPGPSYGAREQARFTGASCALAPGRT